MIGHGQRRACAVGILPDHGNMFPLGEGRKSDFE